MDSIQVTLKSTQSIVDFVHKHSNGLSKRLLSWSATGYYIQPYFDKDYLQEGDWLVYDGYSFIPYTDAHYKKVYPQTIPTGDRDCEELKARISELEKGLDDLLRSINPHGRNSSKYDEWDGGWIGSKTMPSDEPIKAAKQLLNL